MTDLHHWVSADILSLGMAADDARRACRGVRATYLRVAVVTANDLLARTPVPDAAAELRLYDVPAARAEAMAEVRALRERAGDRRVVAYSMADLEDRVRGGWGPLADVLAALVQAGLSDVTEMPVDRLTDLTQSMRALIDSGGRPRRVTVSHPIGDRQIAILERVRACRDAMPSPLYFAPLPRQNPIDKPTTGYEDLRMVALARLALASDPAAAGQTFIEVDWSLYGPKLAQVALTFGADHLDAVSAERAAELGPRRETVQDVERNVRAAGYEPEELRPTV